MSSSLSREPLPGVIRQNEKVVGAVCLPEEDLLEFIEEFNNGYGPLSMHIDAPATTPAIEPRGMFPVGARRVRSGNQAGVTNVDIPPCLDI